MGAVGSGALESEGPGCKLSFAIDQLVTTSGSWAGTRCASVLPLPAC